jgi:hypothetical protein
MSYQMLLIREIEGCSRTVQSGSSTAGFVENGKYLIRPEGIDAANVRIFVDDISLVRQPAKDEFIWQPGFYAGKVFAEVIDTHGGVLGRYGLDVGPSPEKLGQPQFQRMVDDILDFRPEMLLGDGATQQFGHIGDSQSAEVAYARLCRYGRSSFAALQVVCANPMTHLHQQRLTVRPHQVQRVDSLTVRDLARRGFASRMPGEQYALLVDPSRVSVPHVENTYDNAANRAIAVVVDRLIARTAWLCRQFGHAAVRDDDPAMSKVPRRLGVLSDFNDALRRLAGSQAMRAITRPEITSAGLNAISAHPGYARAYQLAWKALRMGIRDDSDDDHLPISPTWEVYERWCFLRIWQMLETIAPSGGWKLESSSVHLVELRVSGVVDGGVIKLRLQPTFPAWDQTSRSGFKSLSRLRQPDFVLTSESPRGRRFLVLDAKYRVTRPNVLEAMESAHLYRDSLRWYDERPWGSYLLLPRHGSAEWLAQPSFRAKHSVGTYELAPDRGASELGLLLQAFIAP